MKKHWLALGLVALTACEEYANTEANFLCGAQTGQPCASLSEVDGAGHSAGRTLAERPEDTQSGTLSQNPLVGAKGTGAVAALNDGGAAYTSSRYRIPEKTGRLWIAPWQEGDVLHEATFAHFILRDAAWGNR